MAGLAAALNAPRCIDAIAWALAARGADGAVCRLTGAGGGDLEVAIRAAMPAIPRVIPAGAVGDGDPAPIGAFVIDGIASVTALDRGYAERGPGGLLDDSAQPYAVILADAERDELVLARNGAGPGLYYARLDDGWVVASEPGALLHAGVAAEPDVGAVRRFIQTGACDDSDRTFFARIRRVLPGEAVVLGTAVAGPMRHPTAWAPPERTTEEAIFESSDASRVAVLITPGLGGAAVLGAALHQPEALHPLPVFTAHPGGLNGAVAQAPAVLRPIPDDTVRHTGVTAWIVPAELDRFLAEMGEPVPDLTIYLLWTVVRSLSGGVDTLVDSTPGPLAALDRIADRLLAHYGVAVRSPLRSASAHDGGVSAVLKRTMPPQLARYAEYDPARVPTPNQVVELLRDEVAAALVPPRPWSDPAASVTALRRLMAGEPADADALLRAYLVERWFIGLSPQATVAEAEPAEQVQESQRPDRASDEVVVGGDVWRRIPVRTAPIGAGDQLLANTAFYVANKLTELAAPPGVWFAVISGKVVAVSQKRVSPVVSVQPRRIARWLARLARRRWPYLGKPWTMQVAIDHSGLGRILASVLLGRSLPATAGVYAPRPGAVPPADAAVVRPPFQPDEVAASLLAAVRLALPDQLGQTLAGVAVVSADNLGCRVLGFANGPYANSTPRPRALLSLVLADNPAGQSGERTPIVVVAQDTAAAAPPEPVAVPDADRLPSPAR